MRILLFVFLVMVSLWSRRSYAQSNELASGFYALSLIEKKIVRNKADQKRPKKPVSQSGAQRSFPLTERWLVGADIALNKNTTNYNSRQGSVLETIHTYAPVYVNFFMAQNWFLECGGYLGMMANSADVSKSEFFSIVNLNDMKVGFDSGFLAGIGIKLKEIGKINLRYNHGMFNIVPLDNNTTVKNRIVEMGITIGL